jgi:hypothetical protein
MPDGYGGESETAASNASAQAADFPGDFIRNIPAAVVITTAARRP